MRKVCMKVWMDCPDGEGLVGTYFTSKENTVGWIDGLMESQFIDRGRGCK